MLQTHYTETKTSPPTSLEDAEVMADNQAWGFDLQVEVEHLENLVMEGTRIPLTELVIVDEESILDRLEVIKTNLPTALATAIEIINRKQEIIHEAKNYAHDLISSSEQRSRKIIQESTIVQQAQLEAARIKLQAQQECDRLRQLNQTEIKQWRESAMNECREIQTGADDYADGVLVNIEQQLNDMLSIIQQGREQLAEQRDNFTQS